MCAVSVKPIKIYGKIFGKKPPANFVNQTEALQFSGYASTEEEEDGTPAESTVLPGLRTKMERTETLISQHRDSESRGHRIPVEENFADQSDSASVTTLQRKAESDRLPKQLKIRRYYRDEVTNRLSERSEIITDKPLIAAYLREVQHEGKMPRRKVYDPMVGHPALFTDTFRSI